MSLTADARTSPTWRRCNHYFVAGRCDMCRVKNDGPSVQGPRIRHGGIPLGSADMQPMIVTTQRKFCDKGHPLDGKPMCKICSNSWKVAYRERKKLSLS